MIQYKDTDIRYNEGETALIEEMPEEFENKEDKIRNSLYYSNQFNMSPDMAYDLEPNLNKIVFGQDKLKAEPGKLFFQSFLQSLADKPAMMLRGIEVYTPGKALDLDKLLDMASTYLDSLKDPELEKRLQDMASGKLWPIGENRKWWQVEAKYLPEVINAWSTNVGDQIPLMLTTIAGRQAGKVIGKPLGLAVGAGAAAITGGPDPSDVATAPAAAAITQEVVKHLGGASPLVAMEAGNFIDEAVALEIDPDIAEKYARYYGLGSGAIEYAQWLWVLGRYSKITKPVQDTILKQALSHIGGSMFEGLEEISQQGLQNFLMQKAIAEMKERHPDYEGQAPETWEGWKRSGAIGSGVAFITGLPGTGMTMTQGALARKAQVKPETKKFLGEPSIEEIKKAEEKPAEAVTPAEPAVEAEETPYEKWYRKLGKQLEKETVGEDIIDQMISEEVNVKQFNEHFWNEVYPQLPIEQQHRFERYVQNITGFKIGDTIAYDPKTKETTIAESWSDIGKLAVEAKEAEYLEGTERGLVALEAIANQWIQQKPVTPAEPTVKPIEEVVTSEEAEIVKPEAEVIEEPELTAQETADLAQLEAEIIEPFKMERVKGIGFVIKEVATDKEVAVVPKRKAAHAKLAELNKEGKEIKGTRRVPAILTDKSTVENVITESRALKASLKKAAQAARTAFTAGKRESIEKVKTYYRELRDRERARKDLKARIQKAVKTISKNIPASVDFFYREAIESLREGIDPSLRTEKTLKERERTRQFLEQHPEKLKDIPVKLMKTLSKKPINKYTVGELEQVAEAIEKLKKQGKLKRKLQKSQQRRRLEEKKNEIVNSILQGEPIDLDKEVIVSSTTQEAFGKKTKIPKAWVLRPMRIFDMLDGKKNFSGPAHTLFIDKVNSAFNKVLRKSDERINTGKNKMKELGIANKNLSQTRIINDVKYTVDEMIGIYNASKNPMAKLAVMQGNNISEKTIDKIIENLTDKEKAWGDFIVSEYDNNYNRLRQAVIEIENRDMGYEENYTPIRRTEIDYSTNTQEIIDAILHRQYLRRVFAEKGFTIRRQNIPAEFQKPIRLNATSVWIEQINKQENYINMAQLIKNLHNVAESKEFRAAVEQKFGKEFIKIIGNYIDRVANPNIYKSFNSLENLSRRLRQNRAIAYLAYNLLTMGKQIPSMFLYLRDAGPVHLFSSAMQFSKHPLHLIEEVREKDPQVKHRAIERELEELKIKQPTIYGDIINKFGKYGMEGLYLFDTVARTIGWNAVYQKALQAGESEAEARRLAQNSTLRTQPAAHAKDLAQLYTTHEAFNWLTMFTNQLNQILNIATYDIPADWSNKQYANTALEIMGLSISALMIWIISNKRFPEKPEDFADAIAEQAINAIPIAGNAIMSVKRGWGQNEIPATELPSAVANILNKLVKEKDLTEYDIKRLLEGFALITGLPYTGPMRIGKFLETGEPEELIGPRRKEKETFKIKR